MSDDSKTILSACGRTVNSQDISHAQELLQMCSGLSRRELALTLCEHWGWLSPTGKPQVRACSKLLEKLDKEGLLALPAKQTPGRGRTRPVEPHASDHETSAAQQIEGDLNSVRPVWLESIEGRDETTLFNAFVERYHFLGYKQPFGCSIRYFITSRHGRLGCLLLGSGARALRRRDEWIGWSAQQRLSNLPFVINNGRYLLFPWVRVPHLASHVLGQLARQVQEDWHARWNYRPVLLETFVDPALHRGICYRAAGWMVLGETTGSGLRLRGHSYRTSSKLILVRPLQRDFRKRLLSQPQPRSTTP